MRYIKYVRVFMLLAVVSMFAACSDDDVKINSNQKGKGKLIIEFSDLDQFDGIIAHFGEFE